MLRDKKNSPEGIIGEKNYICLSEKRKVCAEYQFCFRTEIIYFATNYKLESLPAYEINATPIITFILFKI
jgi:hypothetical protein